MVPVPSNVTNNSSKKANNKKERKNSLHFHVVWTGNQFVLQVRGDLEIIATTLGVGETDKNRIEASLGYIISFVGVEINIAELQDIINQSIIGVGSRIVVMNNRVSEAKSSCRELGINGGVHFRIVSSKVTASEWEQAIISSHFPANDSRQIATVNDVLEHSNNNSSRLLKQSLSSVNQRRIDLC